MLNQLFENKTTPRMPVLFIGHGSPMNAIEENSYTHSLHRLGLELPTPNAILVVSAHWMTQSTWVTEMSTPKTIHDFYGFPKALFDVQYPAHGSPELAKYIQQTVSQPKILGDHDSWGLDHGTWAVLKHIYPGANIPVVQLSLNMTKSPDHHYDIGSQLSGLRDRGVLILGSGNIVHNLSRIQWKPNSKPYDWAIEFDEWIKKKLIERDYKSITNDFHKTEAGKLSIPTLDHYLPLHYIIGASDSRDELKFEHEELQNSSISMRSIRLG